MIKLFHAPQSRSSRMIWLLEELHTPYEIQPVSIFRPLTGEGAPDPANPHPEKQVPAISHEGEIVSESAAIVLYLSDLFPQAGLGPVAGGPGRGAYLGWLAWYAAAMEPAMFSVMGGEIDGAPMKQRAYDAVVERLQETLWHGPYVMGDDLCGADILIGSAIGWGRKAFPASAVLDAYVARCQARPAARRAMELDAASGMQRAA